MGDRKSLENTINQIRKTYGPGSLIWMEGDSPVSKIETVPTGSLALDIALGAGGLPKGRITEIFGNPACGKTSLCLHAISEVQKRGGIAAFIDSENALDKDYSETLGVDLSRMLIAQPSSGEEGLEIMEELIRGGDIDIIVLDSIAALVPKAELAGEIGDSVTYDTPVYIRNKMDNYIDIVPISDLYRGNKKPTKGRNTMWYRKFKATEILTHEGWGDINGVVIKSNASEKKIVVTRTVNGYVKTTEDHCLFQEGREVSTKELQVFDRVDTYDGIEYINELNCLDEETAWLLGFWAGEGSTPRSPNCNRFEVCNVEKQIIDKCLKIIQTHFMTKAVVRTRENKKRQLLYILTCSTAPRLGFLMQQCMCTKSKLKKVPKIVLNANTNIKEAFLFGFFCGDGSHGSTSGLEAYYNDSLPIIAGLQYLLNAVGKETSITGAASRPQQLILRAVKTKRMKKENEIADFYEMEPPETLYDISTDAGTFITALGNIVVHNSHIGLQARLVSQAMRMMSGAIAKTNTIVVFTNQMRSTIATGRFGPSTTTSGGRALSYYASLRIQMWNHGKIEDGDDRVGAHITAHVVKNKIAAPFRKAEMDILFGRGIVRSHDLLNAGKSLGIVEQKGAWYSFDGENIGQGIQKSALALEDDEVMANKLEDMIRESAGLQPRFVDESKEEEE